MTDPIDDEFDDEFDDSWADDVEDDSFDDVSNLSLDEEQEVSSSSEKQSTKKKSNKLVSLVVLLSICGGGAYAAFTMGMLDSIIAPKKEKVPVVKIDKKKKSKNNDEDVITSTGDVEENVPASNEDKVNVAPLNNDSPSVLTPMPGNIPDLEVELPELNEGGFPSLVDEEAASLDVENGFPPGPLDFLDEDVLSDKTDSEFTLEPSEPIKDVEISMTQDVAVEEAKPVSEILADGVVDIDVDVQPSHVDVEIDVEEPTIVTDIPTLEEVIHQQDVKDGVVPDIEVEAEAEVETALNTDISETVQEESVQLEDVQVEDDVASEVVVSEKAVTKKKPVYVPVWAIRAMQPDSAVLFDSAKNAMKTVEVGDIVQGLGRVTFIGKKDNKWTVIGTRGSVVR